MGWQMEFFKENIASAKYAYTYVCVLCNTWIQTFQRICFDSLTPNKLTIKVVQLSLDIALVQLTSMAPVTSLLLFPEEFVGISISQDT